MLRNYYFNGFGYVRDTQADRSQFIKQLTKDDGYISTDLFHGHNQDKSMFLYSALDRDSTMANYLNTITIQSNRKAMAQLKLSNHKLMIERGRCKTIVHKDRTCLHCQVLEDEYHVVIVCPKYAVIICTKYAVIRNQ